MNPELYQASRLMGLMQIQVTVVLIVSLVLCAAAIPLVFAAVRWLNSLTERNKAQTAAIKREANAR